MISYMEAARELDARWTGSLQLLPPTPILRSVGDCLVARQIATTEIDLFNRYAKEIAVENGLKLGLLVDLYDMLLSTGRLFVLEGDERGLRLARSGEASLPAPKSGRTNPRLHRSHHTRE